MAIAVNQKHGTSNVLEVMVTGRLSHQDYEILGPMIDEMVAEFGKIRVFLDMVDFHGWEVAAVWDDLKFSVKHYSDISRIAMVGDSAWERGMSLFCKPFTKAEIRYFERSEIDQGRQWIDAPNKESLGHAIASARH